MKPEQTEITPIPKSSGRYSVGREQCVYVGLQYRHTHTTNEIRALGIEWKLMVKRKAEGDCCTPQRCMTHICYWQHTH